MQRTSLGPVDMLPRLFGVPHLHVNRPLGTRLFHIHLEITILKKGNVGISLKIVINHLIVKIIIHRGVTISRNNFPLDYF